MNEATLALLVPFAFFLLIGTVVWMVFHFRNKANAQLQETIRLAMDKGNELTPEMLDRLGNPKPHPAQDLRKGIVWVAVALGLALLGFFSPDPSGNAFKGMLAVAALPFMIGLAYLVMYKFSGNKE